MAGSELGSEVLTDRHALTETSTSWGMEATRLLDVQRARKAAQEDRLRLSNRVKQLEREERRAHRRIVETRVRAEEVIQLRRRNEERQAIKRAAKQAEAEELAAMRAGQYQLKGKHLMRKREAMEQLWIAKHSSSEEMRAEREQYDRERSQFNEEALRKAQRSKEMVRRSHAQAAGKQQSAKATHNARVKEEYDRRLHEEKQVLMQNEQELQKMAEMELELIQRLKLRQEEHAEAYQELQTALGVPSTAHASATLRLGTARSLPAEEEEPDEATVRGEFSKRDPGGTGYIDVEAVGEVFEALGLVLSDDQLAEAKEQLDPSTQEGGPSGKVSFGDFLLWWNG